MRWLVPLKRIEKKTAKNLKTIFKNEVKDISDNYDFIAQYGISIVRKLELKKQIREALIQGIEKTIIKSIQLTEKDILEKKSDNFRYIKYINEYTNSSDFTESVNKIQQTFYENIDKIVKNGIEQEQSRKEISEAILSINDNRTEYGADTIAITETHRAASWASNKRAKEMAQEFDMVMYKDWIPVADGRTRAAHRAMRDTKPIPMDDFFSVGGEKMARPNDPRGSAANTIRCRCILRYIEEAELEPSDRQTPKIAPDNRTPEEIKKAWEAVRIERDTAERQGFEYRERASEVMSKVHPEDLARAYLGDDYDLYYPDKDAAKKAFYIQNNFFSTEIVFEHRSKGDDGSAIKRATRSIFISKDKLEARHELFVFKNGQTGKYGKKILADSIAVYEKMGLDKVTLLANIDVGGYAWAKYGFKLTDNKDDFAQLSKGILRVIEAEPNVTDKVKKQVKKILDKANAKTVWDLADLDQHINGQKLGKTLLLESEWYGELDLKDKESMDRFNAYVSGRKNTIENFDDVPF